VTPDRRSAHALTASEMSFAETHRYRDATAKSRHSPGTRRRRTHRNCGRTAPDDVHPLDAGIRIAPEQPQRPLTDCLPKSYCWNSDGASSLPATDATGMAAFDPHGDWAQEGWRSER
jgi:hypothetical protein